MIEIPYGYCLCGCQQKTKIASMTSKAKDHTKGKPIRFIVGHNARVQPKGRFAYRWNGGIRKNGDGRVKTHAPNHHKADSEGYVLRYILIAEQSLGKPLPEKVVIHHFDEIICNDKNANLVICENDTYHKLLHQRMRALKACGHPDWRKCWICKEYDKIDNLYTKGTIYHKQCESKYQKANKL